MSTPTEQLIKQLKRSTKSKAILVPLIEDFCSNPVNIDDQKDIAFLNELMQARARKRKKGIYSPSMLASCVRQVYFIKTGKKQKPAKRIENSSYFLNGDFMHFKWQFVMWKMHRAGIIELIGSEIYVENDKTDYGGTIDSIVYIPKKDFLCTVDWKSMNGNSFMNSIDKGPGMRYALQSVGYGDLANNVSKQLELPKKIETVLIIGENKNGPVVNRQSPSPMGLHEWRFELEQYRPLIAERLKRLRAHERRKEVPEPECVSTHRFMFKGCPFSYFCLDEVKQIEQQRKADKPVKEKKAKFNKSR